MSAKSLNEDVMASLSAAESNRRAFDAGLAELRSAASAGRWADVEPIRERMKSAVDGYVDHYSAACRRLEAERTADAVDQ